tara:strand:- start:3680 stop:4408 length:729 start_codon:yes stop_codon:yes gene_type:complete
MLRLAFRSAAPLLTAARQFRGHKASDTRSFATATASSSSSRNAESSTIKRDDEKFMALALREAQVAAANDEVPVGAVLVETETGTVLSSHHNSTLSEEDPTAHAELKCIREGAKKIGSWRGLSRTTLYVTLEPCPMCAGGILNARLGAVVWGAPNPLMGADGSWIRMMGDGVREDDEMLDDDAGATKLNINGPVRPHAFKPDLIIRRRVLEEQCADVMKSFFKRRRDETKQAKERGREEEET